MQSKPNVLWLVPRPNDEARERKIANQKFNIHCLSDKFYDYNNNIVEFSQEDLIEKALEMIKQKNIKGVFAINCYAIALCAIISKLAGLPGPSFKSVFYLNHKYYARKSIHQYTFKDFWYFPIYANTILSQIRQKINGRYPCIFKICCSLHCKGQKYAYCDEDLEAIWSDLQHFIPGMVKKNCFYHKYLDEEDRPEKSPEDMPIILVEQKLDTTKLVEFYFEGVISSREGEQKKKLEWYSFGEVDLYKNGDGLSWTAPTRFSKTVVSDLCKRFQATEIKKMIEFGFDDCSFDLGFFVDKQTGMIHFMQTNSRLAYLLYNYNEFSGPGIDSIKHLAQVATRSKITGVPIEVREKPVYLILIRQYVPGKGGDSIDVEKFYNPPKGFQVQKINLDAQNEQHLFVGSFKALHLSYVIYRADNFKEGILTCMQFLKDVEIQRPKQLLEAGAYEIDQQWFIENKPLEIKDHW